MVEINEFDKKAQDAALSSEKGEWKLIRDDHGTISAIGRGDSAIIHLLPSERTAACAQIVVDILNKKNLS